MNRPTKVIAAVLGLAAFAIAVVAGMGAGNDASTVLARALGFMVLCYLIGLAVGHIGERTVEEHLAAYRSKTALSAGSSPALQAAESTQSSNEIESARRDAGVVVAGAKVS